jgi:hypothetical protein
LIIDQEKLEIIIKLEIPYSLLQLERYFSMTGWLRQYMKKYIQKAEPLQKRKIKLLKLSPTIKEIIKKNIQKELFYKI